MTRQQSTLALSGPKRGSRIPSKEESTFRSRVSVRLLSLLLIVLTVFTGCHPTQPFYFHEDGDLSHYLNRAQDLEYPDTEQERLPEVDQAMAPYRISRPENLPAWDLGLEEAVAIALHNSKIIRSSGSITQLVSNQIAGAGLVSTVYDPAIIESDPDGGVEAALSAFDAQLNILGTSNGNFVNNQDRPTTFSFGAGSNVIKQTAGGIRGELSKRSAGGTQYFARSITEYTAGNTFGGLNQAVNSIWQQSLEMEVRQPILRGRGAAVNRVPVILARINTDISLANFEGNVRSLVLDVEKAYWDLYNAYRTFETNKLERDSAQQLWKITWERADKGIANSLTLAQSEQQFFDFRARLEDSLRSLYNIEANLRLLMGLGPTDGRVIRPSDEPTVANIEFDWRAILNEALIRSPELRQQKWRVESQETQMIAAKNQLLPQFDLGATYRWFGIGDNLINADRNGLNFPAEGSTAWDVLTEGKFQESAFFMQFQMPVGFRRELARVRNVQLQIARERARLEEMELVVTNQLSTIVTNLDAFHQLTKTRFNHWRAADEEFKAAEALFLGGKGELEPVLDAQRRRSEAQREYYRVLSEYNKSIADVHFRKGSLLEYNNVLLEEGPWPEKAYWDALGLARERDASYYLDYGWTRPSVISQGPIDQHPGQLMSSEILDDRRPLGIEGEPTPASPKGKAPTTPDDSAPKPAPPLRQPGPITSRPEEPSLNPPLLRADASESNSGSVQQASYNANFWDEANSESSSRRTANPLR